MGTIISYITLGICTVGCISRILLAAYYKKIFIALKSMKSSRNKTISALKEQFIMRYQAMLGVQNVDYFVGRFLAERRLFGFTLIVWNGLHTQLVTICLLLGAVSSFFMVLQGETTQDVLMAMFQGIWTSTLLLFIDGLCMIPGRVSGLRDGFCDYLENYFKVRLEHEYEVWGKNTEDMKQSKAALDAQLIVADERGYYRKKKLEEKKRKATAALEQKQAAYAAKLERKLHKKREKADKQEEKLLRKQEKERQHLQKHRTMQEEVPVYRARKEGHARIKEEAAMLKREVEERRRREAEAAASKEQSVQDVKPKQESDALQENRMHTQRTETSTEQEQVNELLKEFLIR